MEIWRAVIGFRYYEVSDLGRVRSIDRSFIRKNGSSYRAKSRMLAAAATPKGYLFVSLYESGLSWQRYIHLLVAEAFIGPRPDGLEVNHKDGDKSNNRSSNLEYLTTLENTRHAIDLGLIDFVGEKNPMAKYSKEQIIRAHSLAASGMTYKAASEASGVDLGTVESVCRGKNWKSLGLPVLSKRKLKKEYVP